MPRRCYFSVTACNSLPCYDTCQVAGARSYLRVDVCISSLAGVGLSPTTYTRERRVGVTDVARVVGDVLRYYRLKKRYCRRELARRSGVSYETVKRIELAGRDHVQVRLSTERKLGEALGVEPWRLEVEPRLQPRPDQHHGIVDWVSSPGYAHGYSPGYANGEQFRSEGRAMPTHPLGDALPAG